MISRSLKLLVRAPEGSSITARPHRSSNGSHLRSAKLPGVTDTLATVGGGQQQVVNSGSIYVKLSDIKARTKSQEDLMADAREICSRISR